MVLHFVHRFVDDSYYVGATIIATNLIPDASALEDGSASGIVASFTLLVVGIYIFAFGIPALMLMVRRFHDVGLSGAYVFMIFFAGVGARFYSDSLVAAGNTTQTSIVIALANIASLAGLVVTLWPSQGGVNKYGEPEIKKPS